MKKRGVGLSLCSGLAILGGWVLPAAGVLVQTSFSNNTSQIYYPASASDLLNWGLASMSSNVCLPATLTWGNASNLNDGALGTATATALAAGHSTVWTNTFYLNTSVHTNGYSITNIATMAGWSNSRTSQKYELLFAFKDAPQTFYSYGTAQLNYVPSADGSSKIELTDTTGIIAENVCAIRFIFDVSGTIYREVDVFGYATPSVVIEPVITGGTGPGGIGTTNGASTLSLWVKADSLALTNGAQVASWPDSSGCGAALPGAGTTAGYPAFTNSLLNGRPGIRFSGISYFLRSNVTVAVHEAYVVARFNGATFGNYNGLLMGDPWQNANYMIEANLNTTTLTQWGGSLAGARRNGLTLTNADFNPVNQTWIGSLVLGVEKTSPHISVGAMFQPNTAPSGRCWQGEIAEVATFGNPFGSGLNTLQRSIIENYLSAKYGIALAAGESKYSGSAGGYTYDVFGIGRTDPGNQHRNSGSAGLGLQWFSGLHDGGYIFAGHKTPTNSVVNGRWSRVWYLDSTGFTGSETVMVSFGWRDAGLGAADMSFNALLYSATENGKFNAIVTQKNGGGTVTFTLPASQLSDGYYTLGVGSSGCCFTIR